jgi:hypothetical protein
MRVKPMSESNFLFDAARFKKIAFPWYHAGTSAKPFFNINKKC